MEEEKSKIDFAAHFEEKRKISLQRFKDIRELLSDTDPEILKLIFWFEELSRLMDNSSDTYAHGDFPEGFREFNEEIREILKKYMSLIGFEIGNRITFLIDENFDFHEYKKKCF